MQIMTPLRMVDRWWEDFLSDTGQMTSTRVFPDAFDHMERTRLKEQLMDTIRKIYRVKKNNYMFRCYVDGVEQSQQYVVGHFAACCPLPDESLEEWTARTLEPEKIALIFNYCEFYSDEITQQLSLYIQPLLDRIGIPVNGIHTTVFIGNYKFTPLGIHQDIPGANVIHLHLGPGKKTMYTWEPDLYRQLTGGKGNNQDIEPLLPVSSVFEIEAGDVYFMPWSKYHVGSSDELSAAITIWFDNHQKKVLVDKLFDHIKRNYFDFPDAKFIVPEKNKADFSMVAELSATIRLDSWQEEMKFTELFEDIAGEQLRLLLSNGGWREHAPSRQKEGAFDPADLCFFDGKTLRRVEPFEMRHEIKKDDCLVVYARGEKIILKHLEAFVRILSKLNSGHACVTAELLSSIHDEQVYAAAQYLLGVLYDARAIEISNA
jgi:hypothetical protein